MSDQSAALRAHAAKARADAADTTLDNVRQRCLRAEAAWLAMADRIERTESARLRREAEKAEAVA